MVKLPFLLSSAIIGNLVSFFGVEFSVLAAGKHQIIFVVDPIENHVSFCCNNFVAPLSLHYNCVAANRYFCSGTEQSFVLYFLQSTYIYRYTYVIYSQLVLT